MTLEDIARAATGRHRFRAVMVMAFAALALVLAMVGVFGILAYSVQQSVRDFGVRRALGATTHDVLRLVLTNALRVVGTGAAIGLVLAAMSGRLIETMLFGVRPLDPTTFVAGHGRAGDHGRAVDRRTGVACGADRPRRRAAEPVSGAQNPIRHRRLFIAFRAIPRNWTCPVLQAQPFHATEPGDVVRDQLEPEAACMRGDEQVVGADHLTALLQVSSDLSVVGRSVVWKLYIAWPLRCREPFAPSTAHSWRRAIIGSTRDARRAGP